MSGFHYPGVPVTALLYSLWPLFALIVGGYALRRWDFPGEAFWPAAERLNYFILFPALLFSNLATAPLDDPGLARQALAVLLGLGVAWLALLLCKRWRGWDAGRFGAIAQGVLRFNTYLGLAAVGSLYGKPGLTLAALMLALMVPTVNVMSVWALTAERGISLRALLLPILKNPLILACLAGALVNLAGVGLPGGSDRLLNLLAVASLPLGLLCVGAALKPQELGGEVAALGWNCAARLLAMPPAGLRHRSRAGPAEHGKRRAGTVLRPADGAHRLCADPPTGRRRPPDGGHHYLANAAFRRHSGRRTPRAARKPMTTGRVAAALTALCLLCQPAFGFIKVFPEFDDEPGAATFFWAAVTTVGPFIGSTVSAQESSADEGDKLVQARDDAASFVASDGAIRGAYLQAALQVLRQAPEYAGYSDLQLAAALLARQP